MQNSHNMYFYDLDEECIEFNNKALELCSLDKDFQYAEVRINDITYRNALSIHRLKRYDEAKEIYDDFTTNKKPLSSAISILNCLIYLGHIYSHYENEEKAMFYYNRAEKNNINFFENNNTPEEDFLINKIRILMFKISLMNKFNRSNNLLEFKNELNIARNKLSEFGPEELKSLENGNPHKYPFEIGQEMIQEGKDTPVSTALQVIFLEEIE